MALTLPALVPLARSGFFETHDGLFHVYRLAALDGAVRAGVLYPRWFPEMAFGYGQPVLNFYGPLSYYLGLPFTLLGLDAAHSLEIVFAFGLLLSALGMFVFARLHLKPGPAAVSAVLYAVLPYHLIDLYVRGALAEFLAFAWLPLVLWAFHRLVEDETGSRIVRVGLASMTVTALLITHSLSATLSAPVLAGYLVILLVRKRESSAVGRVAVAVVLAALLSIFYWLPVLLESRYVGLGHGASAGYRDHLLSPGGLADFGLVYPYPAKGGVVPDFPLGLVQVGILVLSLLLLIRLRRSPWVTGFFLAVAYLSALMLTTASLPIWQAFERILALLQYPWRFQLLTALSTAFLAGALVQRLAPAPTHQEPHRDKNPTPAGSYRTPWKRIRLAGSWKQNTIGLLLLALTGAWALWRIPLTPVAPDLSPATWVQAMWQGDQAEGQVGTTWTGEYLPIWVSEQRWALSLPVQCESAAMGGSLPPGTMRLTAVRYGGYDLELDATQRGTVVLHQFYYPGWVTVNQTTGARNAARPVGTLGLSAHDLPQQAGLVSLRLDWTAAQWWGTLVSVVVLLGLVASVAVRRWLHRDLEAAGSLWLVATSLLGAGLLLAGLAWPHGIPASAMRELTPVNAVLEEPKAGAPSLELLSVSHRAPAGGYRPGDTISATLYWRALRELDGDYKAFVHLTDAALTRQPAQHDGDPGGGYTPTSRWVPGELVPDTHHFTLPADLPAGLYRLWAGMYEYETVHNLKIASSETPVADDRVLLAEIEVLAP